MCLQVNSSCGESASGGAYTTVKRETLDQMAQDVAYLKSVLVTLKIVLEEVVSILFFWGGRKIRNFLF